MIKLIARLEDDFPFVRAWIVEDGGRPAPHVLLGAVLCDIETKGILLNAGIATCNPLDVNLAWDWPMSVRVEVDGRERTINCATADPRTVAAARRFHELALVGAAAPGMQL